MQTPAIIKVLVLNWVMQEGFGITHQNNTSTGEVGGGGVVVKENVYVDTKKKHVHDS